MHTINKYKLHRLAMIVSLGMAISACGSSDDDPTPVVPDPVPEPVNTAPVISSSAAETATEGQEYSYTLMATDADSDPLTFAATSMPSWLSFDVSSGVLSGTPAAGDVGSHDVSLTVSDGEATQTQSFSIAVAAMEVPNEAPVITSTEIIAATEAVAYSYTLVASDADGDTLVYSAPTLPAWLSFDTASAILSGTPAATDIGDHAVVLSATDGTDSVDQSFTIAVAQAVVVNTPPVITSNGTTSGTVGTPYSYTMMATDADNDTLSYSSVTLPTWGAFDTSTGILSGTPDAADTYAVELSVSDGTDSVAESFSIVVGAPSDAALTVFENAELPQWALWDCCGGTTPTVVTDDAQHDQVAEFVINGGTVVGFTARAVDGAVGGQPFDATSIAATGTISFELKMTQAPTAGQVAWNFKVESDAPSGTTPPAGEVLLSSSQEGHATPILDTWQTYTFNIADLQTAGLDVSDIDLFMMFPAFGPGDGAIFRVDNLRVYSDGYVAPVVNSSIDLDFEPGGSGNAGYTWAVFENDDNPALEIIANPDASGANTSSTVAKFIARQTGNPWAGTETASGPVFTLDSTNKIVRIMVYKTVISDVGMKFSVGAAAQPELKVANTVVNQWEELTFDFSGYIGLAETTNITNVIVFPDYNLDGRTADTVSHFDNITFSEN